MIITYDKPDKLRQIGEAAKNLRNDMPKQTIAYLTRLLGLDEQTVTKRQRRKEQFFLCDNKHLDLSTGFAKVDANGHVLNQEQILASYLKKLYESTISGVLQPNEITFVTYPINATERAK